MRCNSPVADCGVIYEYDESAQGIKIPEQPIAWNKKWLRGLRTCVEYASAKALQDERQPLGMPVQIPDILEQRDTHGNTLVRPLITRFGYRSLLSVPLLREHQILGGLHSVETSDRGVSNPKW